MLELNFVGGELSPILLNEKLLSKLNEPVVSQDPVILGWIEIDPVYNSPPKGALKISSLGVEFNEFPCVEWGFIM